MSLRMGLLTLVRPVLVPRRRTLKEWQRARRTEINTELAMLRADQARLTQRLHPARVQRCAQCRNLQAVTRGADGRWRCPRCAITTLGLIGAATGRSAGPTA